jgi:hypothetical protein
MGHADFRVRGRIFATLGAPTADWAMIKLPPADQAFLFRVGGAPFQPAAGAWGRQGCTLVRLADASTATVREALSIAHEAVPPSGRSKASSTSKAGTRSTRRSARRPKRPER